jgi:glutaryl-CoA dehydrogenase
MNPKKQAATFDWSDPFFLEDQLSERERAIRDRARVYAEEKLAPRVVDAYMAEREDRAFFAEMGERGLLGLTLSRDFGGGGENAVSFGLAAREIERVDSGYRTMFSVQATLAIFPIETFGSAAQKANYLPKLGSGELIGCFAITEAEAGSDPSGVTARAEKIVDGYRLTGTKIWITNAPIADVFIVWAKSDAHDGALRGFILDRGMAGLSTPKIEGKLSLRASVTGDVVMEGVVVPEDNLLPNAKGLGAALACLNWARYGLAWGVLGAAEDCWFRSRLYTLERRQFGRPLAATQLIQDKLADMQTEIALALQSTLRVGRLLDDGKMAPEMLSILKRNNCGKALAIARQARDMMGANGVLIEYCALRHAANLEAVNTYEGAHDVHALILGRAQTGLQAFG